MLLGCIIRNDGSGGRIMNPSVNPSVRDDFGQPDRQQVNHVDGVSLPSYRLQDGHLHQVFSSDTYTHTNTRTHDLVFFAGPLNLSPVFSS